MKNQFVTYTGRDGIRYLAWRGGNDWYYRPLGEQGMTRIPYNYVVPNTPLRFYKSTDRGAVAKTYNELILENKNNKLNSDKKINSSKKQVVNSKNKNSIPNNSISREINLPEVVITAPKISNSNNLKKEAPKILVTALKPNSGETVKNNITPKPHYTRNYKQRVSELGLNDRDAVKAIQRQLGVYVDGIWGDNTERAYQALRGNMNSENYNNTVFNTNADLTNAPTVNKVPSTLNFLNPGMFLDIINRPLSQLTFAKNGAKLVSKNPIKRFKSFKKC